MMKGKNPQPRILYLERILFRFEGENQKSFTDKQKLKEFSPMKPTLPEMLKGLLYAKKATTRNKRLGKEKSTVKDKHTGKVVSWSVNYKARREVKRQKYQNHQYHNKQLRDIHIKKGCKIWC